MRGSLTKCGRSILKGWFQCGGRRRCDPLTVSDAATRYLLCCRGLEGANTAAVQSELERVFRRYGLRSACGATTVLRLRQRAWGANPVSVWWIKLGILPSGSSLENRSRMGVTSACTEP